MINKYAEINERILLYNAMKGILRVKTALSVKLPVKVPSIITPEARNYIQKIHASQARGIRRNQANVEFTNRLNAKSNTYTPYKQELLEKVDPKKILGKPWEEWTPLEFEALRNEFHAISNPLQTKAFNGQLTAANKANTVINTAHKYLGEKLGDKVINGLNNVLPRKYQIGRHARDSVKYTMTPTERTLFGDEFAFYKDFHRLNDTTHYTPAQLRAAYERSIRFQQPQQAGPSINWSFANY